MKIVVVSDTHIPRMAKKLPSRLVRELADASLILHAGDWTGEEVYVMLARYAPVDGVAGNNDGLSLGSRFGYRKVVVCEGVKIGLLHGHGPADSKLAAERRAEKAFSEEEAYVVIFGHSHIPVLRKHGKQLLFNPGSATDKRKQERYSFGVLDIEGKKVRARHVFYDSKS